MFQISQGTSLFDAVWSPEYLDTFFFLKLAKKWGRFAFNMRMLIELEILMPLSFRQSLVVPTQEIGAF